MLKLNYFASQAVNLQLPDVSSVSELQRLHFVRPCVDFISWIKCVTNSDERVGLAQSVFLPVMQLYYILLPV